MFIVGSSKHLGFYFFNKQITFKRTLYLVTPEKFYFLSKRDDYKNEFTRIEYTKYPRKKNNRKCKLK